MLFRTEVHNFCDFTMNSGLSKVQCLKINSMLPINEQNPTRVVLCNMDCCDVIIFYDAVYTTLMQTRWCLLF